MIEILVAEQPEELKWVHDFLFAHAASLRTHPCSKQVLLDARSLPGPDAP